MKTTRQLVSRVVILALLALPFVVYFRAQAISDWWQLRGYTPPAAAASLAIQDTMTPSARHIFYVNHPQLIGNVASFRKACTISEQTIVLGCYHPDQKGIDVYSVVDPRLTGVLQVTSAHEMLHAAYDRLSPKDKKYIDGLLQDYYKNDLTDQRLIDTIHAYQKSEPNDVVNEMHSVFGTEAPNLPAPLESYYKRYFINRATITSFAASYQAEFTSRQNQVNADDVQLMTIKHQITGQEASLQTQSDQINSDRARLDSQKSSGDIVDYNAGVDSFNAEIRTYNSGVEKLKVSIASYNQLVDARNSIAAALASLDQSIDTRLTTKSTK